LGFGRAWDYEFGRVDLDYTEAFDRIGGWDRGMERVAGDQIQMLWRPVGSLMGMMVRRMGRTTLFRLLGGVTVVC